MVPAGWMGDGLTAAEVFVLTEAEPEAMRYGRCRLPQADNNK
jgi:hypothetical protein